MAQAQAATAGKTEKVLLIASEKVVQVAPDDPLHPVESSIMQWSLMAQSRGQ